MTDMSHLALRLAIALIDRRVTEAQALSDDSGFIITYNSKDNLQDLFRRLVHGAQKKNHPLMNSSDKAHSGTTLGQAFGSVVRHGNVRSKYGKGGRVDDIRQRGSAALKPEFWEKLCTSGGTWCDDLAQEIELLDYANASDSGSEQSESDGENETQDPNSRGKPHVVRASRRSVKGSDVDNQPTIALESRSSMRIGLAASSQTRPQHGHASTQPSGASKRLPTVTLPTKRKREESTPKRQSLGQTQRNRPIHSPIGDDSSSNATDGFEALEETQACVDQYHELPESDTTTKDEQDTKSHSASKQQSQSRGPFIQERHPDPTSTSAKALCHPFDIQSSPYVNRSPDKPIASTDISSQVLSGQTFAYQWQKLSNDINIAACGFTARAAGPEARLNLHDYVDFCNIGRSSYLFGGHRPASGILVDDFLAATVGRLVFEQVFQRHLDLYMADQFWRETLDAHKLDTDGLMRESAFRRFTSKRYMRHELPSKARSLSTEMLVQDLRPLLVEICQRAQTSEGKRPLEVMHDDLDKIVLNALKLKVAMDLSTQAFRVFWPAAGSIYEFPCNVVKTADSKEGQPVGSHRVVMAVFPGVQISDDGDATSIAEEKGLVLVEDEHNKGLTGEDSQ